jgi:hypothetical protein
MENNPINFDEASQAWRENKKYLGRGMFAYRCAYIHSDGKLCKRVVEGQEQRALYQCHPELTVSTKKGRHPMKWCKQHRRFGTFHLIEDD